MAENRAKRIVIADDNLEICELITDTLKNMGHEVVTVHDGYELLKHLELNSPDIIILDLMMPEKNGISILSTIKQSSSNSRIIIYTGHHEYRTSVYARKVDRFVVKGDSIEKLIAAVQEL